MYGFAARLSGSSRTSKSATFDSYYCTWDHEAVGGVVGSPAPSLQKHSSLPILLLYIGAIVSKDAGKESSLTTPSRSCQQMDCRWNDWLRDQGPADTDLLVTTRRVHPDPAVCRRTSAHGQPGTEWILVLLLFHKDISSPLVSSSSSTSPWSWSWSWSSSSSLSETKEWKVWSLRNYWNHH